MKTGAHSSDQKRIFKMLEMDYTPAQISKTLKIDLKVIKSFVKAGATNFQLTKIAEGKAVKTEKKVEPKTTE